MSMRINRGRKDYPLRPFIGGQEIDCRIIPPYPCEERYRNAGNCGYPNRSM